MLPSRDDRELLAEIGQRVTQIVVEGNHHSTTDRAHRIRALLQDYEQSFTAQAAE
jgi:hypothetical protein